MKYYFERNFPVSCNSNYYNVYIDGYIEADEYDAKLYTVHENIIIYDDQDNILDKSHEDFYDIIEMVTDINIDIENDHESCSSIYDCWD